MRKTLIAAALTSCAFVAAASAETLTIATVNNGDMIRMQTMTDDFKKANPGIDLEWVTLEENLLRARVTTDIATKGGQFDILTIGTYETPIWTKNGWLVGLTQLGKDYDLDDLTPAVRTALSHEGTLYAAPFYAESELVYYRKDLFGKAGLTMPDYPTWEFLAEAARKITDRANDVSGICLRGKAGWGENMAFINTLAHAHGGHYFSEDFKPQFDQPVWKQVLGLYLDLLKESGPQGAVSSGYNENLTLFQQGKCGIWVDSSSAAAFLTDPKQSSVAEQVGFSLTPEANNSGNRGDWLWSWALAVPVSSTKAESAQKFIAWATSKHYLNLVAQKEGWANVPPGTRKSLYSNEKYLEAAPFAQITQDAMNAVISKYPHESGIFPTIPQYQAIGTVIGQIFSSLLTGGETVDSALQKAQSIATRELTKAGYLK